MASFFEGFCGRQENRTRFRYKIKQYHSENVIQLQQQDYYQAPNFSYK